MKNPNKIKKEPIPSHGRKNKSSDHDCPIPPLRGMGGFSQLIKTLDSTNKTNVKVQALANYFLMATDKDKVWTIAILSHRRPPRPVNTTLLREWASELAKIPLWLFEESYHIVGDLAENNCFGRPFGRTLHGQKTDSFSGRNDRVEKTIGGGQKGIPF